MSLLKFLAWRSWRSWLEVKALVTTVLVLGCTLSAAASILAVVMNISYEVQWIHMRIAALEEGREAPEYVHQFCTQPRDRNESQPLWWMLPRCWDRGP